MAISISSSLPWSRSLAGGEVDKGHNPLQSAQRSISAEASAWIRSLSLATAVFHSEEPRNISPPFQEGGEEKRGKKKSCLHTSSHQEGIVFGLCSTFCYKFAWCDVCFGRCGGRAAAGMPTPRPAPLLEDWSGQDPPSPLWHWGGDAQSLGGCRRWNALFEGLGCRGLPFALKSRDFGVGGRSRELGAEPAKKHHSMEHPCLGRDTEHMD